MKKISKHYGKRTSLYEENEDRRIKCPEWNFSETFLQKLETAASKNKVSKSKYFEAVVQNFFILENPNLIIASKREYNCIYKKKKCPRLTLHPQIIDDIKHYAKRSTPSTSRYIELLFSNYHSKYGTQIELKKLIHKMQF
jgi:hypothetical protein